MKRWVCTHTLKVSCSLQANPENLKSNMFEGSRCCWIPSAWNNRPGSRYGKDTGEYLFFLSFPIVWPSDLGMKLLVLDLSTHSVPDLKEANLPNWKCDLNLHLNGQREKRKEERKKNNNNWRIHRLMNSPPFFWTAVDQLLWFLFYPPRVTVPPPSWSFSESCPVVTTHKGYWLHYMLLHFCICKSMYDDTRR